MPRALSAPRMPGVFDHQGLGFSVFRVASLNPKRYNPETPKPDVNKPKIQLRVVIGFDGFRASGIAGSVVWISW